MEAEPTLIENTPAIPDAIAAWRPEEAGENDEGFGIVPLPCPATGGMLGLKLPDDAEVLGVQVTMIPTRQRIVKPGDKPNGLAIVPGLIVRARNTVATKRRRFVIVPAGMKAPPREWAKYLGAVALSPGVLLIVFSVDEAALE